MESRYSWISTKPSMNGAYPPAKVGRDTGPVRRRPLASWLMPVLSTKLATDAEPYLSNRAAMTGKVAELEELLERSRSGGGPKYVERHHQRGKMLVRERIELLVDRDSPFLELSPLAAWGTEYLLGANVVTGIGVVEGVECVISANDPTMQGGSSNPYSLAKSLRAQDLARINRMPLINLTESGGADLSRQADVFLTGGKWFRNLTNLSEMGIPTLALVFGNSTAGGAYVPGMCDYSVMVKERAKVFLGGPPLVKMATGEESTDEELGGADMHSRISGLSDYYAVDEFDAIRIGRQIIAHLKWTKKGYGPTRTPTEPLYDQDELLGVASADLKVPFDMREILGSRGRWLRVRRIQTALRDLAVHGLGMDPRLPRRRGGQSAGCAVLRGGAESHRVHPAVQQAGHTAHFHAQHHRLHGRARVRAAGHHQGRRQDGQRRLELEGTPHRPVDRLVVWGGELRDGRSESSTRDSCSGGPAISWR